LLTILSIYGFGARLLGTRRGLLAALVLSLMAGPLVIGRYLLVDSLLTLFVTLSLLTAFESIRQLHFRWGWWVASAVFCGLGVLAKGPVALVLLAGPVLLLPRLDRWCARPGFRGWLAYLGLVFLLVGPWYVGMTLRDSLFASQFFVD